MDLSKNSQKELLFSKLKERDELRKLKVEQKHEAKAEKFEDLKKGHLFSSQFASKKKDILAKLHDLEAQKADGQGNIEESWFNDEVINMTTFDSEKSRSELKDLEASIQNSREILFPKKKFAFRNKKAPRNVSQKKEEVKVEPESSTDLLEKYDLRLSIANLKDSNSTITDVNSGQTPLLLNLTNCTVNIDNVCGNLYIKHLTNCIIRTKPVAGSIWIEKCQDCEFQILCRQLRVHETTGCKFNLWACSRPIIESCSDLTVSPFKFDGNDAENDIKSSFNLAGFPEDGKNLWNEVEDFDFPGSRVMGGSKNWSIMKE